VQLCQAVAITVSDKLNQFKAVWLL